MINFSSIVIIVAALLLIEHVLHDSNQLYQEKYLILIPLYKLKLIIFFLLQFKIVLNFFSNYLY